MTVASITQAIRQFLHTPTPRVLCIRGKWGVGKTFIWNQILERAKSEKDIALPYYCYVSLFGLQSIDEVRQVIFENRQPTAEIGIEPNLNSLSKNIKRYTEAAAQQVSKFGSHAKIPMLDKYISNFSGGFRHIVSLSVRNTIICFDDFERKRLSTKEVLGLVSQLREQKQCKAVLILNEEALEEGDKDEFRKYFEKVVDVPIEFSPTPVECADIAFPTQNADSDYIKKNAIDLGISNIRIIHRIRDIAPELTTPLATFGDATRQQALHTLTLFVWSRYADGAIPTEFILNHSAEGWAHLIKDGRTDEEKAWDKQLQEYKFTNCDDLDMIIAEGVEKGFFDTEKLITEGAKQDERLASAHTQQAIEEAWRLFHSSFGENAPAVVEKLFTAYLQNIKYVLKGNLDDLLLLLRTLGFQQKAAILISAYVEHNKGKIISVDDDSNPFNPVVKDNEFRKALEKIVTPPVRKPIKEVLIGISKGSFTQDDMQTATRLSEIELYDLFKSLDGDDTNRVVDGSLFWRQIANASDEERAFTQRAIAALTRIAKESPLNAKRMVRYGISVDTEIASAKQ